MQELLNAVSTTPRGAKPQQVRPSVPFAAVTLGVFVQSRGAFVRVNR
jgi:hypothetical protein